MKTLILLLSLTLLCSYCKSTKPPNTITPASVIIKKTPKNYGTDLNGNWALKSLWGMEEGKLGKAYINIDFLNKNFSGNAGCNDISGTFSIKGDLLIFDKSIVISKNNCPAYLDKKFISMLLRINRFDEHDGLLDLSQDNIVLMSFVKVS